MNRGGGRPEGGAWGPNGEAREASFVASRLAREKPLGLPGGTSHSRLAPGKGHLHTGGKRLASKARK